MLRVHLCVVCVFVWCNGGVMECNGVDGWRGVKVGRWYDVQSGKRSWQYQQGCESKSMRRCDRDNDTEG